MKNYIKLPSNAFFDDVKDAVKMLQNLCDADNRPYWERTYLAPYAITVSDVMAVPALCDHE